MFFNEVMYKEGQLTILIPTYNRQSQLLELLESLQKQGHFGEYSIIICDNCSDYDIKKTLSDRLVKDFISSIKINKWSFNTGMATNLSIPFLLVDTEWCWFLSDDDFITENALDVILTQIHKYQNVLAIKNSLIGHLKHDDIYINSVEEFVDYYNNDQRNGEMMYLSMIYNMKKLSPFFGRITEYSYTNLSFLLPVLFGLSAGGRMKLESFEAIQYRENAGDNWTNVRALKVALGIRTLMDVDFGIGRTLHKRLMKVLLRNVRSLFCLVAITKHPSWYYRKIIWSNLQPMFKLNTPWYKRYLCNMLFYLFQYTKINIPRLLKIII